MNNSKRRVTVGTRTSPLSLAQTDEVLRQLRLLFPDIDFVTVPISTGGDRHKSAPLLSMARGMFVKEIESALLSREVDVAIHSAKDMPALLPEGLSISAFTTREDPRDVLVSKSGVALNDLPSGARIGTSSPRRQALLKVLRQDIEIVPIRGNVGTRIQKAKSRDFDAVVLAAAGIIRLDRQNEITEYFDPESFVPDTGQGALAIESRESDEAIQKILAKINHQPTSTAVRTERAFLKAMGGGCKVPVAAYASFRNETLHVTAMAAAPDGSELFRYSLDIEDFDDPESIGREVAESLLANGAAKIASQGD